MSHQTAKCETSLQVGDDVFTEALRLHSLGLSVIPIGTEKKPVVRWKPFQREAADERQIWDWWYGRDDLGIGIVLGTVSQGVCGRDFDSPESFDEWIANHQTLARELPITRARRGGHVYYRDSGCETTKLGDGEMRGTGSYLVLPPSVHPSGIRYSWLNPFRHLPRFVDPVEAGLRPKEAAEESSQRQQITALGNKLDGTVESAVAYAIAQTLPRRFGERNDLIFQFARRLRGIPDLRNKSGRDVLTYAEEWFRAALPNIATKEWRVTRTAFLSAWPRITHPWSDGTLTACLADVDATLPSSVALRYVNDPVAMRLVSLCERLQRIAGHAPFFLSTESCGLFGLKHKMQLQRRVMRLINDDVLERLTIGNSFQRKASDYRYLPTIQNSKD